MKKIIVNSDAVLSGETFSQEDRDYFTGQGLSVTQLTEEDYQLTGTLEDFEKFCSSQTHNYTFWNGEEGEESEGGILAHLEDC
jgi:hypothetical protein